MLLFICTLSKQPEGQVNVANTSFVFTQLETPQFYISITDQENQTIPVRDNDDHVQLNTCLLLLAALSSTLVSNKCIQ